MTIDGIIFSKEREREKLVVNVDDVDRLAEEIQRSGDRPVT